MNDHYKRGPTTTNDREMRDQCANHNNGSSDAIGGTAGAGGRPQTNKYDDPPNSRLFIVCGKSITEDDFKEAFEPFGVIEEIWVLKDKVSNEPKGVTYIKFSKTSEAALAMEEMNGRCIGTHPRPLKVLIAHSREQGSRREMNEDERLVRLFVVVPKTMAENDLKDHFNQFGDVDYVSIVRDRFSKESKGFAYVKYHRMSHAAKAFESCDRSFKPVFAAPKPQKSGYQDAAATGAGTGGGPGSSATSACTASSTTASVSAGYDMLTYMDTSHTNPDGNCRLTVVTSTSINQDQLWRLFDIIPGLDYCELKRAGGGGRGGGGGDRGGSGKAVGSVVFNNPQSATYAKEKLHGFEYPPGQRLIVKFDESASGGNQHGGYSAPAAVPPPVAYNLHMTARPQGFLGQPPPPGHHHHHAGHPHHHHPHHHHPGGPAFSSIAARMPPPGATAAGPPPPSHQSAAARPTIPTDLQSLAETIAQATSLIQAAGGYAGNHTSPAAVMVGNGGGSAQSAPTVSSLLETYDPSYCSVKLPAPQPLAPTDSPVAERLFIVCTPYHPVIYILKDVFGRFGNLIDIYLLAGKTCGYAKYADKESAEKAVAALHGQEVCGNRLKVMLADPQDAKSQQAAADLRKRPKIMDQD